MYRSHDRDATKWLEEPGGFDSDLETRRGAPALGHQELVVCVSRGRRLRPLTFPAGPSDELARFLLQPWHFLWPCSGRAQPDLDESHPTFRHNPIESKSHQMFTLTKWRIYCEICVSYVRLSENEIMRCEKRNFKCLPSRNVGRVVRSHIRPKWNSFVSGSHTYAGAPATQGGLCFLSQTEKKTVGTRMHMSKHLLHEWW